MKPRGDQAKSPRDSDPTRETSPDHVIQGERPRTRLGRRRRLPADTGTRDHWHGAAEAEPEPDPVRTPVVSPDLPDNGRISRRVDGLRTRTGVEAFWHTKSELALDRNCALVSADEHGEA